MNKTLLIIFLSSVFYSYGQNKTYAQFIKGLDKERIALLDTMSEYKYIDSDCVGFGGCVQTDLYRFFLKMQEKFSTEELVFLTDNKSITVRIYAFWDLCKKKYPDFKNILNKHLKDKKMFLENDADMGTWYKVNEYYLTLVDPNATVYGDCIKLTNTEYELYKRRIK
jgi:hypothetical protein